MDPKVVLKMKFLDEVRAQAGKVRDVFDTVLFLNVLFVVLVTIVKIIPRHHQLLSFSALTLLVMSPLTSTWPHLNSDVGLEEGLSLCYSIV